MKRKSKLPLVFAVLATGSLTGVAPIAAPAYAASIANTPADGVIKQQSNYAFEETVSRLKADIDGKGIAKALLVGVCDTCSQVVSLPAQSTPAIQQLLSPGGHFEQQIQTNDLGRV